MITEGMINSNETNRKKKTTKIHKIKINQLVSYSLAK